MTHIIHTANGKEYLIVQVMKGGIHFALPKNSTTTADGIKSLLDLETDIPNGLYSYIGRFESIGIKKSKFGIRVTDIIQIEKLIRTIPDHQQFNHVVMLREG